MAKGEAGKAEHSERNGREEVAADQLGGKVTVGDMIWVKSKKSTWWPAQVVDKNNISKSYMPVKSSTGNTLVRLYGSYQYEFVDPVKCNSEFQKILNQNGGSTRAIFEKSLELERRSLKSGKSKLKESKSKLKESKSKLKESKPAGRAKGSSTKKKQNKETESTKSTNSGGKKSTVKKEQNGKKRKQTDKKTPDQKKKSKVIDQEVVVTPNNSNSGKRSRTIDQDETPDEDKLETPGPKAVTFFGKLQELSARRLKVMQNLGLTAPSGSPFE